MIIFVLMVYAHVKFNHFEVEVRWDQFFAINGKNAICTIITINEIILPTLSKLNLIN